jgi:ATP-binding cassette subfamily C protein
LATNILVHDAAAVVMLTSQIVLAFLLAPALAALALGILLIGAMTGLPLLRRAQRAGTFVASANLSLIDDITQFLGALKLAISQNLQKKFTREFNTMLEALSAVEIRYVRQQTISRLAVSTLIGFVGVITIVLGIVMLDVPPSTMITLLLIFSRMNGPAMQLQLDAQYVAHALPAYEKICALECDLASAEAAFIESPGSEVATLAGPIAFKKVSFIHSAERGATSVSGGVREIDLTIEAGSIVGITGPSGVGKTTFADLLVGLYPPQSGEILVGDTALRGPAITAWRNSVSYVSQDPFLFHDTIRRNLLWASPEADDVALWKMLGMVGVDDIVRSARDGLETVVGERGSLLSGGERQRLCLARAMLRHPHLLVLDEATSAIDVEGECAIFERLFQVVPRPTIVIIAHRKESLRYCEHVLVFEAGRIVSDSRRSA